MESDLEKSYDFCGWATRNNIQCSDGRTILKDAFKHCDGQIVPLVWNHKHNNPLNVLGQALLKNCDEGVRAYCSFNDSEYGRAVKEQVMHGDITQLSIYANHLKEKAGQVMHGTIREVSLVLAGANPGAYIDAVMMHGEDEDMEGTIYTGENFTLAHSDEAKKNAPKAENEETEETVQDVLDTLTEKQMNVVAALVGAALAENSNTDNGVTEDDESKGGKNMKHNLFDQDEMTGAGVLSHADQEGIIQLAKSTSVGSLQDAIAMYCEKDEHLAHGFEEIESLFPDYKNLNPGAPELVTNDQGWISVAMNKVHKSPISRIRTRQMDARNIRAKGYKKGNKKTVSANAKLIKRTTDPQTVYRKDALNRDDIIDITDFDVVEYQYGIMKTNLNEEVAIAMMIGDGRDEGDTDKISAEHIRPIWLDNELYTIHVDVDVDATKSELQGTNTHANFGDNYVYAEAIIAAALYAREDYRGSGTPDFYCTPHMLNVMLLARDRNGRRIYDSKSDLAAALNVNAIYTAEQFEGQVRTTTDSKKKKLLGLFVNLADYTLGSTKGGEITRFNQFDIDFNQEKYLIETRLSGALTRIKAAIALEMDVTGEVDDEDDDDDQATE